MGVVKDGVSSAFLLGFRTGLKWCKESERTLKTRHIGGKGLVDETATCGDPEPHTRHNPYPEGTAEHAEWRRGRMVASNARMAPGPWDDGY